MQHSVMKGDTAWLHGKRTSEEVAEVDLRIGLRPNDIASVGQLSLWLCPQHADASAYGEQYTSQVQ